MEETPIKRSADEMRVANRRLMMKLGLGAVGMFAFAFALVPLYNVFCDITGLNGKTGRVAQSEEISSTLVDKSRWITVEFTGSVREGLPWDFKPEVFKMKVHPGSLEAISFYARNISDKAVTGRAVPSLSPGQASKFFNKTECFCFDEQTLQPKEKMEMPVRFIIDPEIPPEITTVTLSYTFFKVKEGEK